MAATGYRTVCIQGEAITENRLAGGAGIKPGHILAVSSGAVILHGTAKGHVIPLVADVPEYNELEDGTARLAFAYASGETVKCLRPQSGAKLYVRVADAQTLVDGVSQLSSAGDGTLQVETVDADDTVGSIKFVAAESKTTAAAGELSLVYVV